MEKGRFIFPFIAIIVNIGINVMFIDRNKRPWNENDRLCSCHFVDKNKDLLPTLFVISGPQKFVTFYIV